MTIKNYELITRYLDIIEMEFDKIAIAAGHTSYAQFKALNETKMVNNEG